MLRGLCNAVLAIFVLSSPSAAAVVPPNFVEEGVVAGLDQPISLAFLPDGRLLFTERESGKVRMIVGGHVAATDPALVVAQLNAEGIERGLQGIAIDPRWPQFPYLYVAYTRTDGMALMRYTGAGDLTNPTGENLTFGSPFTLMDQLRDVCECHNGLGLRFGTDGHLLASIGDDGSFACPAQSLSFPQGKLLRLDVTRLPAGSGGPPPIAPLIPPGNPFAEPDSVSRLIYALGLRNPWRFHVDRSLGSILLADVGLDTYEELDEVFAGNNLGWPHREGPLIQDLAGCPEPGGPGGSTFDAPIIAVSHVEGFTSISTAGVYRPILGAASNWPATYWGTLFYGDFYDSRLRRLVRSGGTWLAPAPVTGQPNSIDWATGIFRVSDWMQGPDGSLYWLQFSDGAYAPGTGSLRRIRYVGPAVTVPPPGHDDAPGLMASPNPFRSSTVLTWRMPGEEPVRIELFDLVGRRVRGFEQRTQSPEGRTEWDGTDQHGVPTSAGVYLARVIRGDRHEVVRLLHLR